MLDKIIDFSVRNKLIIGFFICLLIIAGIFAFRSLPIDAVPDITNNQVQVITTSPSLAAQEVERFITFPVEQGMATIPGIEEIRSFSRFGLSVVTIVFKEDIDIYWARQQVSERLATVTNEIPNGYGSPEMSPVTTGLGEIYQYTLHMQPGYEGKYSPTELRTIQDWVIRRQLLGIEGVADVSSFGGYKKQLEIAVNPALLKSLDLSLEDVWTAVENNNMNTGSGYIEKGPLAWYIRTEGMLKTPEELEQIPVKTLENGVPVLLKEIAKIQEGHATRYGAMTYNDQGEVVGAIVLMLKGDNASKVVERVKERVERIQKNLPEGLIISPYLDRTKLVDKAITTAATNLIEGALIVVLILVLILGNIRAGMIVASVIPLSMLFALVMMNLFGVSGNLMSLGAIDFGIIVDGAVIIVETIVHRLSLHYRLHPTDTSRGDQLVREAASSIRKSSAFGEMIILIVYLPILSLAGIEGKMFRPMAETVAFAIAGAFLLSLTYVPMMSALLLGNRPPREWKFSQQAIEWLKEKYAHLLGRTLKQPVLVIGIAIALMGGAVWQFNRLGGEFIPSLEEGDFALETRILTGGSLKTMVDASGKASAVLLSQFPDEVKEVVGKIGSAEIPVDPMPFEACDLIVVLKDKEEWTKATSMEELAVKMEEALQILPGITFSFQQPIQMRFNELISGARQDVVLKIFGEDMDQLSNYADQAARIAQNIEGVNDLQVEQVSGQPQLIVKWNRTALARFGISISDASAAIQAAYAGRISGFYYEQERRFEVAIRLDSISRADEMALSSLSVRDKEGHLVPIEQLAEIGFRQGPNQIQRENAQRRITVGFNVRGADIQTVVEQLQTKMEALKLEPGYHISYGGQFENLENARSRLAVAVPIGLLLILLLLYLTFHSVAQALLIFTAIPLSAIGGIAALWVRDMPFSISAGIGFIALFGVAVLNGIVMVAEYNKTRQELDDPLQAILEACKHRFRPVLMTALVASLGFLPMALSHSAGAEVQRPLATVVVGGLLTATFLTLFVLPAILLLSSKKRGIKPVVAGLMVLGLGISWTQAQVSLSREQAIQKVIRDNPLISIAELETKKQALQSKVAWDLGNTQLDLQYGQYNSYYARDNQLMLSQNLDFPGTYIREAAAQRSLTAKAQAEKSLLENTLSARTAQAYDQVLYWNSLQQLLLSNDSILAFAEKAAELRLKTGAGTLLEKDLARQQRLAHQNELQLALTQQRQWLLSLGLLLQTNPDSLLLTDSVLTRSYAIPGFSPDQPLLKMAQADQQFAYYRWKAERSRLAPGLKVGVFSQTLTGSHNVTGQEILYGPEKRFNGVQAGLSLPLFFGAQKARIKSSRYLLQQQELSLNWTLQSQQTKSLQLELQFRQQLQLVNSMQQEQLPLVEKNLNLANKSFREGQISFFELNQTRSNWLQFKKELLQQQLQLNLIYYELLVNSGKL